VKLRCALSRGVPLERLPLPRRPTPRTRSALAVIVIAPRRLGGRSRYRLRKQTVKPAFGRNKEAQGFRQFLLRGLDQVQHEWALVCIGHYPRKLAITMA